VLRAHLNKVYSILVEYNVLTNFTLRNVIVGGHWTSLDLSRIQASIWNKKIHYSSLSIKLYYTITRLGYVKYNYYLIQ